MREDEDAAGAGQEPDQRRDDHQHHADDEDRPFDPGWSKNVRHCSRVNIDQQLVERQRFAQALAAQMVEALAWRAELGGL